MKISDVKVYVMGSAWRNFVVARVRTDEGLDGIGEARPVNREEAVTSGLMLAPHNVGASVGTAARRQHFNLFSTDWQHRQAQPVS